MQGSKSVSVRFRSIPQTDSLSMKSLVVRWRYATSQVILVRNAALGSSGSTRFQMKSGTSIRPAHQVCKRRLIMSHSDDSFCALQVSEAVSTATPEVPSMARASSKTVTGVVR